MQKLKKSIRNHGIKIMCCWLFIPFMIAICMLLGSITPKSLTSYCKVYNENDLNRCWKENPYVEIHTKQVVDAGYDYLYNNKKVARFSLVELNGYVMMSLIEPEKLKQLQNDTSKNIVIKGKLEKFENDAKLKGYNAIKESLIKAYQKELTREEVLNLFTLVQFNQYSGSKMTMYIFGLIGMIAILFCLFLALKQIPIIKNPNQYHLSNDITLENEKEIETIMKELETPEKHYKNIDITKHYLVTKTGGIKVAKRENIAWIYEKIVKQNGISTRSWIVYSLDQKKPMSLSVSLKKHKELGEQLQTYYPNATFGYQNEFIKKWKQNPKSFLKNEK